MTVGSLCSSKAEVFADYSAQFSGNGGSGTFAPYYVASLNHGLVSQSKGALARGTLDCFLPVGDRLSFNFGIDLVGDYASSSDYLRWVPETRTMVPNPQHPARGWVQELYGRLDFRSVFLSLGLADRESALLNNSLTSGDLVESGNARAVPQARIGFNDFVDIPLTRGWVQIQGEIAYGKFTQDSWLENHFNHYAGHVNTGSWYTYKRCYFRTMPSQPFSVTVGMQMAGEYGGKTVDYAQGKLRQTLRFKSGLREMIKMFLPVNENGSGQGNSLGCWDLHLRCRLSDGTELKAYLQKPFEDGSSLGFRNGFDGLWGLEYQAPTDNAVITGAVVEYLDFTNQCGPLHWSEALMPGTSLHGAITGADNYYNNYQFNAYANYGMSLGTPFLPSPIYDLNGSLTFMNSRVRGFHAAVMGRISPRFTFRLMGGWRKGWGTVMRPLLHPTTDTSMMAEVTFTTPSQRLLIKGQVAFDHGKMLGNNCGGSLTVAYRGNFSF